MSVSDNNRNGYYNSVVDVSNMDSNSITSLGLRAGDSLTVSSKLSYDYGIADPETGEILVTVKPDGVIEFGKNYEPDEAAEKFWEAIFAVSPKAMREENEYLEKEIEYLKAENERLSRVVDSYRMDEFKKEAICPPSIWNATTNAVPDDEAAAVDYDLMQELSETLLRDHFVKRLKEENERLSWDLFSQEHETTPKEMSNYTLTLSDGTSFPIYPPEKKTKEPGFQISPTVGFDWSKVTHTTPLGLHGFDVGYHMAAAEQHSSDLLDSFSYLWEGQWDSLARDLKEQHGEYEKLAAAEVDHASGDNNGHLYQYSGSNWILVEVSDATKDHHSQAEDDSESAYERAMALLK